MTYNPKTSKKCSFIKMSSKGRQIKKKLKKKTKAMTSNQRAKALSDWRKSW